MNEEKLIKLLVSIGFELRNFDCDETPNYTYTFTLGEYQIDIYRNDNYYNLFKNYNHIGRYERDDLKPIYDHFKKELR